MAETSGETRERSAAAELTPTQNRAVDLIADGRLRTVQRIADALGIGKRTLEHWISLPAFKRALQSIVDAERAKLQATNISQKQVILDKLFISATSSTNEALRIKASVAWAKIYDGCSLGEAERVEREVIL